ncbi:hypothetical protein KW801_01635 [Candidatus Saccharibacteria bacterium]|nr:hypothetical protein [Candidatus Saccharibacteria bacterium]
MAEDKEPIEVEEPAEQPAESEHHNEHFQSSTAQSSRLQRVKTWYIERKKWTIPVSVLLFILILAGVPFSRYALAGLAVKKDLTVKVLDSTANTPVSGATVSIGSITAETDGTGKAILHKVKAGHHKASFTKKYYQTRNIDLLSPILSQKATPEVQMTATGRQVKITITNAISKKPLSEVNINVADVTAKTDKDGSAIIVLPAGNTEQKAKLSLGGYNDAQVTVKINDDKIQANSFSLTPAGEIYFLSKLSGKIDVVKTNLDGTNRQTVLAGTGKEDDRGTVLLASRDWKYLALLSKRAGGLPALYLINTSDDSLTTMDTGDADFSPAGWVNDDFVYTTTKNATQLWQAGRQVLKSYSAPNKKITTLDQTTASGTGQADYISQLIGSVYAYGDQILYIKNWTTAFGMASNADFTSKQATFNGVKADGSGKRAIKSFGLASGTSAIDITLEDRVENPGSIDLHFSDGNQDNFYVYANGQVKDESSATADSYYTADYPTYLQSPSGDSTFWSESRDGKNTLFTGDASGQNGKQVATLSDYNTYGWFTDNYLLVSKNSSELYIMGRLGDHPAIKISDYHKPSVTFYGYGGGYGGL